MTTINWYEFDENKKSDLASLNFISNIKEKKDFINSIKEHQKWFKQYYEKNKPKSDEEFLTYFCNTYFTCPHCKYKNNCKRNDPHYPMAKNPFMSSPNPAPSCCKFSPIPASSPFNYEYWKTHNKNNHLVKMQHTFNTELYDVLHEPISSFKTIEVVTRKADFAKNHILPRDFIGLTIDGKSDYTYYVSKEDFYYNKYRNFDGSLKWFYKMFQVRDKIDHHIQLYTLNFEMFDGTIYEQISDVMKRLNKDYVKADRMIKKGQLNEI